MVLVNDIRSHERYLVALASPMTLPMFIRWFFGGDLRYVDLFSRSTYESLKPTTQPPALRVIEIEFSTHDTR